MYKDKRIPSCNPRKLTSKDIAEYVTYRRANGILDTTINKDISLLRMLLKWIGNDAVERYKAEYGTTKPLSFSERQPPLDNDVIEKVYDLARSTQDYRILQGCVAVILGTACGLRPQESRQLYVYDVRLDGINSSIYVRHVKGEGKWGEPRPTPVMDGVEDIIGKYLEFRARKLEEFHKESDALFPPLRSDREFMAQQSFGKVKVLVEEQVGAKFQLRAGRRAFGQRALDSGQELKNVSVTMGHASVVTTQRYYANYRQDDALNAMLSFKNAAGNRSAGGRV